MMFVNTLKEELGRIQSRVRSIAKENGIKVRRHRISGIDAYFSDGTKVHYHGWKQMFNDFQRRFSM